MKSGSSCSATFNLEGWQINSMRVSQQPRTGRVTLSAGNHYVYTAGKQAGPDEFTIEFDTTQFDWYSGRATNRTRWQVKQPFLIQ
jgi:hypothetical protein